MSLRQQVEREARDAAAAVPLLTDGAVTDALERAAALVGERREAIAAANAADVEAAGGLDAGSLDRLRLDPTRIDALAVELAQLAALPPLERDEDRWELENGLRVSVRRIPIGAVGANFEARPNVAIDVAGQLLKSLNAAVLRTGGAALRTVTVLVDEILRPALDAAGLPPTPPPPRPSSPRASTGSGSATGSISCSSTGAPRPCCRGSARFSTGSGSGWGSPSGSGTSGQTTPSGSRL